jgi:hypothetical protein
METFDCGNLTALCICESVQMILAAQTEAGMDTITKKYEGNGMMEF